MSDLTADQSAITAFGATHQSIAAEIAGAANMDTATHVAAMTPVFGLIGADYLAMFAAAQVLHCSDVNDLSAKCNHLGQSAFGTVAVLGDTDDAASAALGAIGNGIGG
ncbi:type VII secretion target [Nocardia veterana]|uniref:ESX-1 secretion-associated protein n=1 Tax=Nocardia veterana TaxID=132249 RepID=A0A7X6RIS6_9NOCA|nr:type VII secretion target [Nocardia veterana]NKY86978.1 ESX-1 secretion-associated protein [Nocardia veterana]